MWRQPRHRGEVLSVVERGWRGARECSLTLNAMAIPVTHLIKGYLTHDLRTLMTPFPYIGIVSVPRPLFPVCLWMMVLWKSAGGRLRWVVVDHERTLRRIAWWCRVFRLRAAMIRETDEGYALEVAGRPISLAAFLHP